MNPRRVTRSEFLKYERVDRFTRPSVAKLDQIGKGKVGAYLVEFFEIYLR
jgi:hypothetical protein